MNDTEQVRAARTGALAVPREDFATFVVTGNDRVSWLNGLLTSDVAKATPARASYGLAVGRNGKVLADLVVVVDEAAQGGPRLALSLPREAGEALRAHFDHYVVMEDVEIADASAAFRTWTLHGPRAVDALSAAREAGAIGGELDLTGLGDAIVLAPADRAQAVEQALAAHASLGDAGGWDALRLERGVPRFGVDFDDKTYPQEASLEKTAVAFDKGCYLGQEVVFMLEKRGHVKRRLVPLVVDAAEAPPRGAPVTDESGAATGEVTSAARSPTLGKPVALAMVKRAHAVPGQNVLVAGAPARVVERPA
jgi:folate-binding protein YgfZ